MSIAKPNPDILEDIKKESSTLIENLGIESANFHLGQTAERSVNQEVLGSVFRLIHSLKGLAMMAAMRSVEKTLHLFEDLLERIKSGSVPNSEKFFDIFLDLQELLDLAFFHVPESPGESFEQNLKQLQIQVSDLIISATDSSSLETNSSSLAAQAHSPTASGNDEIVDIAILEKYAPRGEKFYAVLGQFDTPAQSDLHGSETWISLSAVGDIVFCKQLGQDFCLLLATDLDYDLLSQLTSFTLHPLDKKPNAFSALPHPWSHFLFSGAAEIDVNPPPVKPISILSRGGQTEEKTNHSPASTVPEVDSESSLEMEDFDHNNKKGLLSKSDPLDLDPEMLLDFLQNADELMESMSQSLLALEANPNSLEAIESIFRSAHTIKGTAGMFGFRAIERLTHECENIFDKVRKNLQQVTPVLMDAIFSALDKIRIMFESLKKGGTSEFAINDVLEKLSQSSGKRVAKSAAVQSHSVKDVQTKSENVLELKSSIAHFQDKPVISTNTVVEDSSKRDSDKSSSSSGDGVSTIRVDLKRLDSLVNLVGELVIDRTRFSRIEEELRSENANSEVCHRLTESVLLFSRHMNEVQSIIMKVRMVPVGNAFYKFTRVVRDLSKQLGKEINLVIEGGETELDKTLVEEIADPLVHLVRNSVDHGIEMPAERQEKNKPVKGTIKLSAYQDGNVIVIAVSDDGRGLNIDKIRKKAIAQGLIKVADTHTNKDIFNLIFEPGFSTADQVTNISGRGVGMDVVKKNIVKLRGIIEIESEVNRGMLITIRLPLTLAIIPSLMIEVLGENYAIPIVNVIESIRIHPGEIQRIGRANFVKLRDQVLPLIDLAAVFNLDSRDERMWYREDASILTNYSQVQVSNRQKNKRVVFVVVGVGEKRVGIEVSRLQGQQEIVIKSLGSLIGQQRGVAGACVQGNGRVALVLDVGEIIDSCSNSRLHLGRVA